MSPARSSLWRLAYNCAAGTAAFVSVCALMHRLAPLPRVPIVGPKLGYFGRHAEDYDTIFVGSSRVYRQIAPQAFDDELRARGIGSRSFNFGAPAMIPPESFFVLEKILPRRGAHLRWVFIEWAAVKTEIEKRKEGTIEVLYWHDWRQTAFLARTIAARHGISRSSFTQKLWPHLRLFLRNTANVGRGTDFFAGADAPERDRIEGNYARNGGYFGARGPSPLRLTDPAGYQQMLAAVKRKAERTKASGENPRVTRVMLDAINRIEDAVRACGAEPVWFIPPTLENVSDALFLEDKTRTHTVFVFNRPELFAELYRFDRRWDAEHLNEAGSREFTHLLAGRFADFLARRQ